MNDYQYKMLINGEMVGASETFPVLNPATGNVLAQAPQIESQQVEQALSGASAAFKTWSSTSLAERSKLILAYADLLEQHSDEIIDILIAETGKPINVAEYDFGMFTTCLRFFVEEAKRTDQPVITDPDGRFLHYIMRQPLGVVVGYLAWNFPLLNMGYKLGPSLASGCTAIVKPSQVAPLASLRCAELSIEAGIPAGVMNVISSDDYAVTEPLLTSEVVSLFTMIGSTRAGVSCMKSACTSVKHFSVELGGNAPVIVYDDADLKKAAWDIVDLKFSNTGQVCVSPNRCFVHESVYEAFLNEAKARAEGVELASGRVEGRIMGPMMTEKERDRVLGLVHSSVADGARLVLGGNIPEYHPQGFFMEPTILADATPAMAPACDETFGPVLTVIPFSDSDDIIAKANDSEYGLAAYVYTTNLQRGLQAAEQIVSGSVCINEAHYGVHLPHGGLKQSGVGKDCSQYSLAEYLTLKRVSVQVKD